MNEDNEDSQAIRGLIETWLRATQEGDVEAVLDLMAPDVIFLAAGQPPMVGRDAFEHGMRSWMKDHAVQSTSQIEEVVVEGNLAYCRTQLKVTLISKHGNTPVERSGHTLSILRKGADGKWLLTRDANMLGSSA
ncbi:MAG: YybH family protein [Gammaproteobacteria bacterium]